MRGHSLYGHCGYEGAADPQDTDLPARDARILDSEMEITDDANETDPDDDDYELAQEEPNDTDSDEDGELGDNTIVRSHHFVGPRR
jgi:hypothetical protein